MKIEHIESLHADAGPRLFDFLKITTDDGLVGWSEYNESFGGAGVSAAIDQLAPMLIGKDPRAYEAHVALMQALRRAAASGTSQQAIGAIENALLDVKARALGIPVYELLGGPVRERIRLYWSHCAMYRVRSAEVMGLPPVRTLDDLKAAGREVLERGYSALKTNILLLDGTPRVHTPGFARGESFPELNAERPVLRAIERELAALREAVGPDVDILVDLNFNFKTEGFLKVARAMEPFDLFWVEIDTRDSRALRYIREQTSISVATGETLSHRREYKPFLEEGAADVMIVDVPFNGLAESLKMAAMCDAYEVNVAPHNFYSHLATMMNAAFCAVVPNLRIMEYDEEAVPWRSELVTVQPNIQGGYLQLPTGPGWGTEVNEAAVRAHPPRR